MHGWRFVVDDAGFAFDIEESEFLEREFYAFLNLLDHVRDTPGEVRRSAELFAIESRSGRTLVDHLLDPAVDRDVRVRLHTRLDRLTECTEDPGEWEFTVDQRRVPIAPGIGICVRMSVSGTPVACLTTASADRRGRLQVAAASDPSQLSLIFFLTEAADFPFFWRSIVDRAPDLLDGLEEHQHLLFPNTVFAKGIWGQLGRLAGPADEIRRSVVSALAGLDDHAGSVWAAHAESDQRIRVLQSLCGVVCSPESPNTHKTVKAMRLREVDFDGRSVSCEWHVKLSPTRNRIHFAVCAGVLFVGIFAEHLPV